MVCAIVGKRVVPDRFLGEEQISFTVASEAYGISPLADEMIVKRLEGGEVERAGGWEMGDRESNVRDRHFGDEW